MIATPADIKPLGCRYMYKLSEDGIPSARLVAQGCGQWQGLDYHETFAPTTRMEPIRLGLQVMVQKKMIVEQMDFSAAYLNSDLDRPI